ncbi:MAG: thiol:disulfide interchange protein DsbA/DsbL [Lysobacteraceae bacterium]
MFRGLLVALALVVPMLANAQSAEAPVVSFVEGKHYFRIEPALATESPGKVEVTEVFSYGCPACFRFEQVMERIRSELPENATLRLEPASFREDESWPLFQRAYLTARQLGIADRTHAAMFEAIWAGGPLKIVDRSTRRPIFPSIEQVADFYATQGADRSAFLDTATSSKMETRMMQGDHWVRSAGTDSTPTLVVNGKWRFTPRSAGGVEPTIALIKHLVAMEAAAD